MADPVAVANQYDREIGQRLKNLRQLRKVTQQQLASRLNLTFQQIQKYETGANRISAGRLMLVAAELNFPLSYFMPENLKTSEKQVQADHYMLAHDIAQLNDKLLQQAVRTLVQRVGKYVTTRPPAASGSSASPTPPEDNDE